MTRWNRHPHAWLGLVLALAAPTFSPAAADVPEGDTLDTIEVEEGWGDGRITERDARAFCEWGVNVFREPRATARIR